MDTLKLPLADILADWQAQDWLRPLDRNLALLLLRQGASDAEALLAALVSHQVGRGHTCLSITALAADPERTLDIPPAQWQAKNAYLMHSSEALQALLKPTELLKAVFTVNDLNALPARWLQQVMQGDVCAWQDEQQQTGLEPLVYQQHSQLLFLRRYWAYEQRINQWLQQRMRVQRSQQLGEAIDPAAIQEIVQRLIPDVTEHPSWQRIACANTAKQSFSVITGGPGTGKTYTVLRVLATLSELHRLQAQQRQLRIALAAPTGKAAARMQESISQSLQESQAPEFTELQTILPSKASTLHRLLGSQRNSRYFRHHRDFPLPYDVVVVDEASMIDTEMFDALLDALAPSTRLILLGDKDQLAPVEAGSILAALCQGAEHGGYSADHWQWLQDASGEPLPATTLSAHGRLDNVVMLHKSMRFSGDIADLALAVNACAVEAANEVLSQAQQATPAVVRTIAPPRTAAGTQATKSQTSTPTENWLTPELLHGYADFVQACGEPPSETASAEDADAWALRVLSAYGQFQFLTALRAGPYGQKAVNAAVAKHFGHTPEHWYHGRPVMVTANDYSLNLNNGDIGVALNHPESGLLKVVFPGKEPGTVRWVLPSRLSQVETVYAMTVHKSQGSEFAHAVLVLPDRSAPVLTKELIYTGITRAKKQLTLVVPNQQVWHQAITQRIERLGGLFVSIE